MRKLISFTLIAGVIVLLANCSPKVSKKTAKTANKTEEVKPPVPPTVGIKPSPATGGDVVKAAQGDRTNEQQVQSLSTTNDQRLAAGGKMYETNCKKCHDLFNPASRSATEWVEIMKSMGPKAKLETPAYLTISAYLVKNAKQ